MMDNDLLQNIGRLHTTTLGAQRIIGNLRLQACDAVAYCSQKIADPRAVIARRGKNWYIDIDGITITVNAYSYTIITAHREK